MSLIPYLINDPLDWYRPTRLWDWEDDDDFWCRPSYRSLLSLPNRLRRELSSMTPAGAEISFDKDKFRVNVDVQQFAPNEITVRTAGDNSILVEGKHEEKQDEHGYISRQFVRRYTLPKGHDISQVQSSLSSDGVLTITAPRLDAIEGGQKYVPIQRTGAPTPRAVESKK
uniref:Small heat shock protein 19.4 n=1 Tax=Lasioderma serricorne TaxID=295660 RepID=A0A5B8NH37_9COLE|nr:small heat shock protein 19.4 [Lasioderma serricorne]